MQSFDPLSMIVVLSSMALLPFMFMITTCFLKIAIVLVIVRNALGVQQVPPTMAIYGIALALTVYIMAPVFVETQKCFDDFDYKQLDKSQLVSYLQQGSEPLKKFMLRHTSPDVMDTFVATTKELWPKEMQLPDGSTNLLVLIPSFVVSEIQSGFKIGFLVYLPFIVIDILVSNILLALGMQMVSPATLSMPLKILLFVVANGWEKLLHSLALGYL
jgi:type III secretion protein R